MILRPVRPQSPSGPPTTKLPVGLTRKSLARFGIQPSGSAEATASPIKSLTIAGEYFFPFRVSALCCVETTTLVQPIGLPSMYSLVACALLLLTPFFLGVDASGDIRRLAVQQHLDIGAMIGESVLVITDVPHHSARDLADHLAVGHCVVAVLGEQRRLATAFAGD